MNANENKPYQIKDAAPLEPANKKSKSTKEIVVNSLKPQGGHRYLQLVVSNGRESDTVSGTLDSGASQSVGPFTSLYNLRKSVVVLNEPTEVRLADSKTRYPVKAAITTDIHVTYGDYKKQLKDVVIYLVEVPSWNELLVGLPALRDAGMLDWYKSDDANK